MDMSELFRKSITDEERIFLSGREISEDSITNIREDENDLSDEKKSNFIEAINSLVQNERQYNKIVVTTQPKRLILL